MKIVDVCGFYSETGGGVRSYVHHKFDAARKAGHDLMVIAPGEASYVQETRGGRIAWVKEPAHCHSTPTTGVSWEAARSSRS